jgi:adenylate cyclase
MASGHTDGDLNSESDASPEATNSSEKQAAEEVAPRWRRAWGWLHSRFARQIAIVTVTLGTLAAVGHFVGGVIGWWEAYRITIGEHSTDHPSAANRAPGTHADVLSLVILPLTDESESHNGDWFADMLTSDLTAEIGRLPSTLVISRDTARTYKGKAVDPREVAKELAVRYVIRGSTRRNGDRVHLDLEMADGETGLQVWSRRLDIDRTRLAGGLGDLALQLARALNIQTLRSSGARVAALKPNEVKADDLAMQGWASYLRGMTPQNIREAARLCEQAVQRDPQSARGWGCVGFTSAVGANLGWIPDREAAIRRLKEAAEQLRQIDENGFYTLLVRISLAFRAGDYQTSLTLADALIERFPSHAPSYAVRGRAMIGLGRFDECLEPLTRALRIGPQDPLVATWRTYLANCHFMRADYAQAEEAARIAWKTNPRLPVAPLTLAAALQREGKVDEARKIIADYLSSNTQFRIANLQRVLIGTEPRFVEGRERMIDSLRKLGMT